MAETVIITTKTSSGAPNLSDLSIGEFCLVEPDGILYLKTSATNLDSYIKGRILTQSEFTALTQTEKDNSGLVIING